MPGECLEKLLYLRDTGKALKATKVLVAKKDTRERVRWDRNRDGTQGFPTSRSRSPCNERHQVQQRHAHPRGAFLAL